MPKVRILNWLKGEKWAPPCKPSRFAGLKGKVSQLPVAIALPEHASRQSDALADQNSLNSQESSDEEPEPAFGEIRPGATDLRR